MKVFNVAMLKWLKGLAIKSMILTHMRMNSAYVGSI